MSVSTRGKILRPEGKLQKGLCLSQRHQQFDGQHEISDARTLAYDASLYRLIATGSEPEIAEQHLIRDPPVDLLSTLRGDRTFSEFGIASPSPSIATKTNRYPGVWVLSKPRSAQPADNYTAIRGAILTRSSVIILLNFRTLGSVKSFVLAKTSKTSRSSTATIKSLTRNSRLGVEAVEWPRPL
ncbi:hypothetical protein NKI54_34375 [Mesorhizobium sp. M0663]|uniref:hypothetical protein n=1 Tax=Mesorhizobium sp. M0663 TaxID=2956981 RepID=UPI00333C7A70